MGDTMYDLNRINDCLNTKVIGRTIIQYDSLASTYSKAKNIFGTCPDGAVVLSEDQSKWNIRMGNEWICYPEKNIYLSIIFKPLANNHLISKFDVIGCASLCDALNSLYDIDCKIKWPNDILIGGSKVSSVSSSLAGKSSSPGGAIISFGINTNMNEEELESDEELKNIATSLMIETSEEIDREELIGEILNNVEKYYSELIHENSALNAVDTCNQNSFIANKAIEVMKKGKKSKRKVYAKSIDPEGWLIVKNEKGNEEILSPGETIITYEKNA
ncbi:MAG TPA: biotin--[acetyl-CoA-carboxylase] ligase [Clostridiales bacterium]|nr:biotin--[acetyl-CoA-carboxylase] ligase [Clostridiales bacterium]